MSETVEELQGNLYEIDKEEEKEKRIVKLFEWQLGKDILELFNDKQIIEIMLNQDKAIWVEKFGIGKMKTSIVVERIQAKKIIEIIEPSHLVPDHREAIKVLIASPFPAIPCRRGLMLIVSKSTF